MILARNSITLHHLRDITTVVWYYKLQASTASPPTKPTTETPSGWSTTEPSYTEGSTNSLYVVQKTTFSDGSFEYSDVSLSTSYEAAKAAYNKSVQAKDAADAAQESVDNLEIGGRNLIIGTLNPDARGGGIYRPHLPGQITNTAGRGTCTVAEHGLRFTLTSANWAYIYFGSSANSAEPCMLGLEAGKTYTLSADLSWNLLSSDTGKANTNTYGMGAILAYSTEANPNNFVTAVSDYSLPITQADKGTDMSGRLVFTFTVPSDAIRLYLGIRANNTTASHYAIGDYLEARNMKLEKGDKATDWTPAPEDVEADINEAKKTANNYISADNTGLMVANMADGNTYTPSNVPSGVKNTFIDEDSLQVRDGTDVLARFGTTSQIGTDDANHQVIDGNGISGVNVDGLSVFNVAMNAGNIQTTVKRDVMATDALWSVPGGGTPTAPDYIQTTTTMYMPFDAIPSLRDLPPIVPSSLMYFRVGEAPRSAQSLRNFVSGVFRYGDETPQTLRTEHVEFVVHYDSATNTMMAEASLIDPSIEVTYDDSITVALATGNDPFTFVVYTPAPAYSLGTRMDERMSEIGAFSGICGEFLSAKTRDQFACGRFNRDESDYAFMVGNGDDTNGYSNALAVTWDGNQLMALDETATSGTDADLYSAITALGWESEVLV